jgi:hypothetical protein
MGKVERKVALITGGNSEKEETVRAAAREAI